jgi:hypothetical protein
VASRAGRPAAGAGGAGATGARATGAEATRHGAGRLLIAVYGVFAISASARAAYQLLAQFSRAPLAYLLSGLAALVYVVATLALARATPVSRRVALAAVCLELAGVLGVGALSAADPSLFADASVWSGFGSGYGYVPLVLPVLGLAWLWRTSAARAGGPARR